MTRAQELAQTVTDAVSELVWAGRLVWADRVVGDQSSCVVCGTFWPHHEEGCFAGELENNVKALAEAGERAREARPFTGEPTITRADWPAVEKNFYRSPSGLWVYKWADEHLILAALGEGS